MENLIENTDIFICSYLRNNFTQECLQYLKERTKSPHTTFLVDNGGNAQFRNVVDYYVGFGTNMGIHCAWNVALALARSKYFVTADNDLLVPILGPDWLSQMVKFMDERPDYGAISMAPHIFIGAAQIDPNDLEDVKERNMCGAVFRIMRTDLVRQVGGWEHEIRGERNHEERTICGRLQEAGYKVGIATRIRAWHNFGETNWGYPETFSPEEQGHNPELKDYVGKFNNRNAYDSETWLPA